VYVGIPRAGRGIFGTGVDPTMSVKVCRSVAWKQADRTVTVGPGPGIRRGPIKVSEYAAAITPCSYVGGQQSRGSAPKARIRRGRAAIRPGAHIDVGTERRRSSICRRALTRTSGRLEADDGVSLPGNLCRRG